MSGEYPPCGLVLIPGQAQPVQEGSHGVAVIVILRGTPAHPPGSLGHRNQCGNEVLTGGYDLGIRQGGKPGEARHQARILMPDVFHAGRCRQAQCSGDQWPVGAHEGCEVVPAPLTKAYGWHHDRQSHLLCRVGDRDAAAGEHLTELFGEFGAFKARITGEQVLADLVGHARCLQIASLSPRGLGDELCDLGAADAGWQGERVIHGVLQCVGLSCLYTLTFALHIKQKPALRAHRDDDL
ncbi:hypothetical protein NQ017_08210 [Corynebacterium sp. 732RC1]|uniref:hypothetical protein n=1 Tax=unclassified Corynebacterium TaxID=2624378 RepID=UPI00211C7BE3|nr:MULTISPECIES: hypothetical protein [unclassified Corynebacterium]MCQ9359457.1 hypothetical protein [Corynebacterium sp. 142RC1]MCQ9363879.1 hypothetical protein [Corynebacterium sp. 732RC1]MCQ9365732.1 hypothetical protein [Corynebacterium sp. 70RC1]